MDYWREMYRKVTLEDIIALEKSYKGGDEERQDIQKYYNIFKGRKEQQIWLFVLIVWHFVSFNTVTCPGISDFNSYKISYKTLLKSEISGNINIEQIRSNSLQPVHNIVVRTIS